jgi:uncharacterized protein (DUF2236 family)
MSGTFAPASVIRRVDGERALLLGGGRALLMQLAHPSVAAGVAEHSDFQRDPFARLVRTMQASYTIIFGSTEDAHAVAAGVRAVHARVVGPGYRADDPALLLWVHATLVDTALRIYERLLGRLTPGDAEAYYQESTLVAEMLGCPRDVQPVDLRAFRDYVRTMVGSLEVTDTARSLARSVLHPPVPFVAEPLAGLARAVTIGLLPTPLRRPYGLARDTRQAAALRAATAAGRRVLPLVPKPIRRADGIFGGSLRAAVNT